MAAYEKLAAVYDRFMEDVDYQRWAQGLAAWIGARTQVADLACGTGNLTLPLARMGYGVTGVDLSADMLMVAQDKARRAGLRIPFIRQDVRRLQLMRPVQAAVMACDGLNYLLAPADVAACLARVYANLQPGGVFLFDISSRHKLEQTIGNNFFGVDTGEAAYLWKNQLDPDHRLHMDITFFLRGADGRYDRFDEVHVQRAHSREEIEAALARAGIRLLGCFSDLLDRVPATGEAQRLHFVAQRPQQEQ